jgi:subtilisin-like proprotein convertase family protein
LNTPGAPPAAGLADEYDAALGLGVTFVDPAVNLRVTPLANGGAPPNEFMDIVIGNPGPTLGLNLQLLTNYISAGNGNGVVDTNECNVLDLVLTNAGAAEVTGIQATLTTTTPGVIVAQRSATYTNMPPGAVATNQPAFQVSVMPNFVCGTPINFALIIRADQGTLTNRFTRLTGVVGTPVRFDNFNVYPIPDDNLVGTNSPFVVSNFNSAVAKVSVALHIDHTFDADLRLYLISPDGITNALAINQGGSANNYGVGCQDNFRTIFDDDAGVPVTAGFAPFLGADQPEERLAVFTGRSGTNVNGTWQVRVVDEFAIDLGSIQCWSLYLSPSLCDDGGGQCPGVDLC